MKLQDGAASIPYSFDRTGLPRKIHKERSITEIPRLIRYKNNDCGKIIIFSVHSRETPSDTIRQKSYNTDCRAHGIDSPKLPGEKKTRQITAFSKPVLILPRCVVFFRCCSLRDTLPTVRLVYPAVRMIRKLAMAGCSVMAGLFYVLKASFSFRCSVPKMFP